MRRGEDLDLLALKDLNVDLHLLDLQDLYFQVPACLPEFRYMQVRVAMRMSVHYQEAGA